MKIIGWIKKNYSEKIRISESNYQGHNLIDIRVCYDMGDGKYGKTKKGISFKKESLPELKKLLNKIKEIN